MSVSNAKKSNPPCRVCQRSRWLMTITILVILAVVVVLEMNA
ncbi:MAG: hypothetical protein P1U57_13010 [Oleibacter sp.]|nr:hypothetical protein [Thalassolituus sp.]